MVTYSVTAGSLLIVIDEDIVPSDIWLQWLQDDGKSASELPKKLYLGSKISSVGPETTEVLYIFVCKCC